MLAQVEKSPSVADVTDAAERAVAAAGAPRPVTPMDDAARAAYREKSLRRDQEALARLAERSAESRSVALQRAIETVIEKREAENAAARLDDEGEGPLHDAWLATREALEDAASALAEAPIACARDALTRGEAYLDAIDRDMRVTDVPCADTDQIEHMRCLRAGLEWLAGQEPDRTEWDDAVRAYRKAEDDVNHLSREGESIDRAAAVDDGVRESHAARQTEALAAWSAAAETILRLEPADVGGLLVQMEIVFGRGAKGDVRTYVKREAILGSAHITEDELWSDNDERGYALLAVNAAKLRDRAIPADWRETIDGFGQVHPGLRDAARNALDARLDLSRLREIALGSVPNEDRPTLLFDTPDGKLIAAKPTGVWQWEPVK